MTRVIVVRILNLFGTLLVVLLTCLAYFLPLNANHQPFGMTEERQPLDMMGLPSLVFVPIYFQMILFALYQLLPMTHFYDYLNHGVNPYYFVICLCNCGWLLVNTFPVDGVAPWLPLVFCYPMTLALIAVYLGSLRYIVRDLKKEEDSDDHYYLNYFFGRSWIGSFLSWAIVLSLSQSFTILAADPATHNHQNMIYYALAYAAYGLISILVVLMNRDVVFGLTTVWCSISLAINSMKEYADLPFNDQLPVFISAICAGTVVLFCTGAMLIRNIMLVKYRREHKSTQHSGYVVEAKA